MSGLICVLYIQCQSVRFHTWPLLLSSSKLLVDSILPLHTPILAQALLIAQQWVPPPKRAKACTWLKQSDFLDWQVRLLLVIGRFWSYKAMELKGQSQLLSQPEPPTGLRSWTAKPGNRQSKQFTGRSGEMYLERQRNKTVCPQKDTDRVTTVPDFWILVLSLWALGQFLSCHVWGWWDGQLHPQPHTHAPHQTYIYIHTHTHIYIYYMDVCLYIHI